MSKLNISTNCQQTLKIIGTYFKEQRMRSGDKIYSVSISLGVTHPVISKIENGKYTSLNIKLIVELLEYYNLSIEQLFQYIIAYEQNISLPTRS